MTATARSAASSYLSEHLLKRIGNVVTVTGLAWQREPKSLPTNALAAKVLCKRHNEALSPLDTHIVALYDVLKAWRDGQSVGEHNFAGYDTERWAIKLMLGYVVSGSASHGGRRVRAPNVPLDYVRTLFGEVPITGGMYVIPEPPEGADGQEKVAVWLVHQPPGHPEEDTIIGIGVRLLDMTFFTTVGRFPMQRPKLYRPTEVLLGEAGFLRFSWPNRRAPRSVSLARQGAQHLLQRV